MLTLPTALTFAGVVAIVTIKPGPGILAAISRSLSDGWKNGAAIGLGHTTMHIAYFVLVCLTFTSVPRELVDFVSILLKALGAAFMIQLGVKEFMRVNVPLAVPDATIRQHDLVRNYLAGLMIGLSNPIVVLFYAGLVPTVIVVQDLQSMDIVLLSLVILVLNGGGQVLACYSADHVRQFFHEPRNARFVRVLVGLMFVLIGLAIGLSTLPILNVGEIYFGTNMS